MSKKKRFVTVLETGAGYSCLRLDELSHRLGEGIEPLDNDLSVVNASGNPVLVIGCINSWLLGLVPDGFDTKFRKRYVHDRDITTIKNLLPDQSKQRMGED